VREWGSAQLELERKLVPHVRSGRLKLEHTIVDGFENVVSAFLGLLKGQNMGKMLVRAAAE
jgi:NADPH-dependent curcumin reductase CurA